MALSNQDLMALVGVMAILVGVIFYNNYRARRAMLAPAAPGPKAEVRVGAYVLRGASIAGEIVAIEDDRVVLRQAGRHRVVRRASLTSSSGEVSVGDDVDWEAAEAAGKAWEESGKPAAPAPGTVQPATAGSPPDGNKE